MANNKYTIKYTETFVNQFKHIMQYFTDKLQNRIAAENFYKEVITEIEKRRENPKSFEIYKSTKQRESDYYRIYVKNYTIFYVVNDNIMEIRRILYSRRNFKNLL